MTDPDYRHYTLIVDRSGSMASCSEDTEGGIRYYIEEQRKLPGRATVSLWQFDTVHEEVFSMADINDGRVLGYRLLPRGKTALLDATGTGIVRLGEQLAALPEDRRPGKVVFVVATDGQNNSSVEYTLPQVRKLITMQREQYGWVFYFVGAGIDAFADGSQMGYTGGLVLNTSRSAVMDAYVATASASSRGMAAGADAGDFSYTPAERASASGLGTEAENVAESGGTPARGQSSP